MFNPISLKAIPYLQALNDTLNIKGIFEQFSDVITTGGWILIVLGVLMLAVNLREASGGGAQLVGAIFMLAAGAGVLLAATLFSQIPLDWANDLGFIQPVIRMLI